MLRRLWLVAVPLVAGAAIALSTAPVWAFTQQTLTPNGNYNFDYGPLDKSKSDDSADKSDPNRPGFHFSIEQNQSGGFRSFGGDNHAPTPDPYYRTFGN